MGMEAREVVGGHRLRSALAAEDRRHDEVVAARAPGALARASSTASDGRDDVVAQDVLQLDRLGRRRDRVRVQARQDRVLVEDVVELALEARQLLLGQTEAGEMGDVLDVGTGQRSHARDDTGRNLVNASTRAAGQGRISESAPSRASTSAT